MEYQPETSNVLELDEPVMTYTEFIAKHRLQFSIKFKGFEAGSKKSDPWPHFAWEYEFKCGSYSMTGSYRTGIGHGKLKGLIAGESRNRGTIEFHPKVGLHFRLHSGGCYPVVQKGIGKPYGERADIAPRPWFQFEDPDCRFSGPKYYVDVPTAEQVLDSLRSDAEAALPTFEEFASEYGYDADSRSAENIYQQCCETERKLRGMVGISGMAELQEVERL